MESLINQCINYPAHGRGSGYSPLPAGCCPSGNPAAVEDTKAAEHVLYGCSVLFHNAPPLPRPHSMFIESDRPAPEFPPLVGRTQ